MKSKAQAPLRTADEVKESFIANGIAVAAWAKSHGFKRHTVVDLLSGRRVGRRGEAHRAAVALGMKADPLKRAA